LVYTVCHLGARRGIPGRYSMRTIWQAVRQSAVGIFLILAISAILLFSDLGQRKTASRAATRTTTARRYKVGVVYFSRDIGTDLCVQGMVDGLRDRGFAEGKNLEVQRSDAQGDMSNIPAMLQNYDNSDVDIILTVTTPVLTAASNLVKHKPVVFTCVTDPVAAGAGKSFNDHLPYVTGVGSFPPVGHTLEVMRKLVPSIRAVGTIYNPAEANSVKEMSVAREIYRQRGIRLEEVAITSSSEVLQAVQILAGKDIQAVLVPGDNTAIQGLEAAVKGATDAKLPLFTEECDTLDRGGVACVGLGLHNAGLASGHLAGRVLAGANPKDLPMEEVAVEEVGISSKRAAQFGITIPPELSLAVRNDQ
jgi:putative tryptophan/tyrosine transport system substrate-binding protein